MRSGTLLPMSNKPCVACQTKASAAGQRTSNLNSDKKGEEAPADNQQNGIGPSGAVRPAPNNLKKTLAETIASLGDHNKRQPEFKEALGLVKEMEDAEPGAEGDKTKLSLMQRFYGADFLDQLFVAMVAQRDFGKKSETVGQMPVIPWKNMVVCIYIYIY